MQNKQKKMGHASHAMTQLTEEQRLCLEMVYFQGLSQTTIAKRTDTPLATVRHTIQIGREKLERLMQE